MSTTLIHSPLTFIDTDYTSPRSPLPSVVRSSSPIKVVSLPSLIFISLLLRSSSFYVILSISHEDYTSTHVSCVRSFISHLTFRPVIFNGFDFVLFFFLTLFLFCLVGVCNHVLARCIVCVSILRLPFLS